MIILGTWKILKLISSLEHMKDSVKIIYDSNPLVNFKSQGRNKLITLSFYFI
jgi:hypothetical protein